MSTVPHLLFVTSMPTVRTMLALIRVLVMPGFIGDGNTCEQGMSMLLSWHITDPGPSFV